MFFHHASIQSTEHDETKEDRVKLNPILESEKEK